MNHDIFYIATDRMFAKRMALYGGYNIFPNIEKLARGGTLYTNAFAAAASTLMCHSCEWTGLYPWQLHDQSGVPYSDRLYETQITSDENLFTDLIDAGYDVHLVFVQKPGKYYETYTQASSIWGKEGVYVHLVEDWDVNPANNREVHLRTAITALEQSRKRNKPCFVWMKIHGFYKAYDAHTQTVTDPLLDYVDYAGQQRVTRDDCWNAIVDDVLGKMMKELGHLQSDDCPEIIFASDHGSFQGEYGLKDYGFHLTQEILHVPFLSSYGAIDGSPVPAGKNPLVINNVFSTREVRNIVTRNNPRLSEEMVFAETLYPGQVSVVPGNKNSFSKIAARTDRYKYIYQPWGFNGRDDTPQEMLFDLWYDPYEKANLAGFDGEYHDYARGTHSIKKDVLMRYHSDPEFNRNPENYFINLDYKINKNPKTRITENYSVGTGWEELNEIRQEFRHACKEIWNSTGRSDHFKL